MSARGYGVWLAAGGDDGDPVTTRTVARRVPTCRAALRIARRATGGGALHRRGEDLAIVGATVTAWIEREQ